MEAVATLTRRKTTLTHKQVAEVAEKKGLKISPSLRKEAIEAKLREIERPLNVDKSFPGEY